MGIKLLYGWLLLTGHNTCTIYDSQWLDIAGGPKKQATKFLKFTTSWNIDKISKFFQCHILCCGFAVNWTLKIPPHFIMNLLLNVPIKEFLNSISFEEVIARS